MTFFIGKVADVTSYIPQVISIHVLNSDISRQ